MKKTIVIEGNAVYEVDDGCMLNKEQSRKERRSGGNGRGPGESQRQEGGRCRR